MVVELSDLSSNSPYEFILVWRKVGEIERSLRLLDLELVRPDNKA